MDEPEQLPVSTKVYLGPPTDAQGRVTKHPLKFGQAESLVAMDDLMFFTPGVLYARGRFSDSLLVDYMYEVQEDVPLYYHKFSHRIFRGLDTPSGSQDWNFALWAISLEFWESFADFLCSVSLAFLEERLTLKYGLQVLHITDPLALEKAGLFRTDLPQLPIAAFGLNSNRACALFQQGQEPGMAIPKLTVYPPTHDMLVYAQAYFAGQNPVDARDAFIRRGPPNAGTT